jgi:putative two-component system response regulator
MIPATVANAKILIVDDELPNMSALGRVLTAAGYQIVTTTNPVEALTLYQEQAPEVMLLDLHMPGLDGIGVINRLKQLAPSRAFLPVLVLTGDTSPDARRRVLAAGAKDFVAKPFDMDEVLLRIRNLLETGRLYRELNNQNQLLEERVRARTAELESASLDTLERLAIAAEFRDDETGRHTERVGEVAALLGTVLGLAEESVFLIRRAAPLHDVGKIGIPDSILRKPGPLTTEEWDVMKGHASIGARILSGGRSSVVRFAEEIALSHHEHWDGQGYPSGLAGEKIPLAGRLVMVADVLDALTSDRVYRKAWPVDKVMAYIWEYAGKRFDPHIAALLERNEVRQALLRIRARESAASETAPRISRLAVSS